MIGGKVGQLLEEANPSCDEIILYNAQVASFVQHIV